MLNPQLGLFSFSGASRLLVAAAFALFAGCASPPPQAGSPGGEPQEESDSDGASGDVQAIAPEPENRSAYPNQDLTENLLYNYLFAEIALQRGNVALAALERYLGEQIVV